MDSGGPLVERFDALFDASSDALGRSRGGFSTKIHLKTDFGGLPIAFHLTGGKASDSRNLETLLDIGPDINPRAALGDKSSDFKSNREAARHRGEANRDKQRQNRAIIDAEVRRFGRVINTD